MACVSWRCGVSGWRVGGRWDGGRALLFNILFNIYKVTLLQRGDVMLAASHKRRRVRKRVRKRVHEEVGHELATGGVAPPLRHTRALGGPPSQPHQSTTPSGVLFRMVAAVKTI